MRDSGGDAAELNLESPVLNQTAVASYPLRCLSVTPRGAWLKEAETLSGYDARRFGTTQGSPHSFGERLLV